MFYSKTKTKAEGIPTRLLSLSRSVAASAHSLEKKVLAQDRANQTTKRIILSNLKSLEPEFVAPAEIIAPRLKRQRVNKKLNPPPCAKKKKTNPVDGNRSSYLSASNEASSPPFKHDGSWWTQGGFGLALKRALWPEKLDKGSYRLFIRPWRLSDVKMSGGKNSPSALNSCDK